MVLSLLERSDVLTHTLRVKAVRSFGRSYLTTRSPVLPVENRKSKSDAEKSIVCFLLERVYKLEHMVTCTELHVLSVVTMETLSHDLNGDHFV